MGYGRTTIPMPNMIVSVDRIWDLVYFSPTMKYEVIITCGCAGQKWKRCTGNPVGEGAQGVVVCLCRAPRTGPAVGVGRSEPKAGHSKREGWEDC